MFEDKKTFLDPVFDGSVLRDMAENDSDFSDDIFFEKFIDFKQII